jgi:hypothetical protein
MSAPPVTHAPPPKRAVVHAPVKRRAPMLVVHHTVTHVVAPRPKPKKH